jgi:hypothetical protein
MLGRKEKRRNNFLKKWQKREPFTLKKRKIYLYGNFVAACSAAIFLSDFICKAQVLFWGERDKFFGRPDKKGGKNRKS